MAGESLRESLLSVIVLSGVKSISYLDYIFNSFSLCSIDLSLSQAEYDKLKASGGQNPIYVYLKLGTYGIYGEVVSYTSTRVSAGGAYEASLLLVPVGASDRFTSVVTQDLFSKSITTSRQNLLVPKSASPVKFKADIPYQTSRLDSVASALAGYRKQFTIDGFASMRSSADGYRYTKAYHRLAYLQFGSEVYSGQARIIKSTPLLWGDYNFAGTPDSGAGNFLSEIKAATDMQISFTSGRQGLLNSLFAHIPTINKTYQDSVGHLINETFKVTITGNLSSKFPGFAFGPNSRTFGAGTVSSPDSSAFDGLWSPPSWPVGTKVYHLKTNYVYSNDGTDGTTGHTLEYVFGWFNKDIYPA